MKLRYVILLSLLISAMISSCSNEKENEPKKETYEEETQEILQTLACPPHPFKGEKDDILGKWKVVKGRYPSDEINLTQDRSCESVFYEFLPEKMIVSGDEDHPLAGEHEYSYRISISPVYNATPGPNLRVGEEAFFARPYPKYMHMVELDHLWGETLIRIE